MAETQPLGPIPFSTDLALAMAAVVNAPVVAIDTETTGVNYQTLHLVGVSLYVPTSPVGFYLPVLSMVDADNTLVPLADVLDLINMLFSDPDRILIFHNAVFDLRVFFKNGLECHAQIFDTMYAEHRLDNGYKQVYWHGDQLNYKLKTLTRRFLDQQQMTFEDATGGLPFDHVPFAQTAPYAVGDTYYTYQHYLRQTARLILPTNSGLHEVLHNFDFPLLPLITVMISQGIPIDVAFASERIAFFRAQFDKRSEQISRLINRHLNISEKAVLRSILQRYGLPVFAWSSLSEDSLNILRSNTTNKRARLFINLVLSRRYLAHLVSKFFVPLLKRTDPVTQRLYIGSFHSLNSTGRFSATDPNAQALQKGSSVRRMFVAEEGRSIVAADFRNIEPRCLAQALLMFLADHGQALAAIKQRNRDRAHALFSDLLDDREFTKPYAEPQQLPYPPQSLLAQFFINPPDPNNQDPYRYIAQIAFGIPDPTNEERARMKTIVLAVIFGKGINSLMADLKLNFAGTVQCLNQFATVMPELGSSTYHLSNGQWIKNQPQFQSYKEQVWEMLRHSGEITSLFGRKRRFPGLYYLRKCQRCRVFTFEGGKEYEWDVAPVQLWNYTLHTYVYRVWHVKTGTLIGTANWRLPLAHLYKTGALTAWPFRQISYRTIRRIEVGGEIVHFTPIEKIQREGFNAVVQATAGDVFKQAILRVHPVMQQFDARMILNVHDELVFSVPTPALAGFIPALEAAMTEPPALWWQIPIAVDIEVGPNYGQLQ